MMKALWTALVALALFGLFAGLGALAWFECAPPTKTCASCHEIRGARDGWAHSVHTNVSCKACHGGTLSSFAAAGDNLRRAWRHVTATNHPALRRDLPLGEAQVERMSAACGRCHQQEYAGWARSGHAAPVAKFLLDEHHNRAWKPADQCLRCHGMFLDGDVETILARGYAVMSACYCEMSPDVDVRQGDDEAFAYTGLFELWPKRDPDATDNITAIGAWAWGLSRGLDLAFTIPEIDAAKSVATGCSRLAKTPLLACSRDERFAVCVPNQTGGGGVPLAKRDFGENVSIEMASFPHWYCKAYGKYIDNEQEMKFDQHLLVASIAPRRILVEGFNSGWFDTKGEWLACVAASPAWEFLGRPGLPKGDFPANFDTRCIGPYLGYVRRGGQHGITGYDWNWLLDFADRAFAR